MTRMPFLLAATFIALAAGAPSVRADDPGTVLERFYRRCLTPVMAGEAPDSRPELAGRDAVIRVSSTADGLQSCALSLQLTEASHGKVIDELLAARMAELGFRELPTCDLTLITDKRAFESAGPTMNGLFTGVLIFTIKLDARDAGQINLIAAQSDRPLVREEKCGQGPGGAE